jgi:hypothetical protein
MEDSGIVFGFPLDIDFLIAGESSGPYILNLFHCLFFITLSKFFLRKYGTILPIFSDKCEIVHVLMFEEIFDRKWRQSVCKKSASSLSEKIRETWFFLYLLVTPAQQVVSYICTFTDYNFSFLKIRLSCKYCRSSFIYTHPTMTPLLPQLIHIQRQTTLIFWLFL